MISFETIGLTFDDEDKLIRNNLTKSPQGDFVLIIKIFN